METIFTRSVSARLVFYSLTILALGGCQSLGKKVIPSFQNSPFQFSENERSFFSEQWTSEAMEDFQLAEIGQDPKHATPDPNRLMSFDGGTRYFNGNGYYLIILKRLWTLGKVDGYLYGPILKFGQVTSLSEKYEISNLKFYSKKSLRDLLKENF